METLDRQETDWEDFQMELLSSQLAQYPNTFRMAPVTSRYDSMLLTFSLIINLFVGIPVTLILLQVCLGKPRS